MFHAKIPLEDYQELLQLREEVKKLNAEFVVFPTVNVKHE